MSQKFRILLYEQVYVMISGAYFLFSNGKGSEFNLLGQFSIHCKVTRSADFSFLSFLFVRFFKKKVNVASH